MAGHVKVRGLRGAEQRLEYTEDDDTHTRPRPLAWLR